MVVHEVDEHLKRNSPHHQARQSTLDLIIWFGVYFLKMFLSFRTSARKPRKPKSDCEEVAHPAHLSAPFSEEVDSVLEGSTLGQSSKRRLYNAKCPDILLPSSKKVTCSKYWNKEFFGPNTICSEGGSWWIGIPEADGHTQP